MKIRSESEEQILLLQWCKRSQEEMPELKKIFAIPNGGVRHIAVASRLKLEGVKKGVPDLFLPVSRRGFHGLFIEMKRIKGGILSKEQKEWFKYLHEEKYACVRADGFERAKQILIRYLGNE